MKEVEIIFKAVVMYFLSVGMVAIGWNLILTRLLGVPVFGFGELCLLTFAINLLAAPIQIGRYASKE